jgi:hypothetical protein
MGYARGGPWPNRWKRLGPLGPFGLLSWNRGGEAAVTGGGAGRFRWRGTEGKRSGSTTMRWWAGLGGFGEGRGSLEGFVTAAVDWRGWPMAWARLAARYPRWVGRWATWWAVGAWGRGDGFAPWPGMADRGEATELGAEVRWEAEQSGRELDGSFGKRSEWLLLRTDSEEIGRTGGGRMRCAWSGRGGVGPVASAVGRQHHRKVAASVRTELARSGLWSDWHCSDGPDPNHCRIDFPIFKLLPNFEI